MINFLSKNKDRITPSVYKRSLLFYDWNERTFFEKQKVRRKAIEDYKNLLVSTKLVDNDFIKHLILLCEQDFDFCALLNKSQEESFSEFSITYNLFRCFGVRMLAYLEVYEFMRVLLINDNSLSLVNKNRAFENLEQLHSIAKREHSSTKKGAIFVISKHDLEVFSIKNEAIENSLAQIGEFYNYLISYTTENIVIEFSRGKRQLPLLHLIQVESEKNHKPIYFRNIGEFISLLTSH